MGKVLAVIAATTVAVGLSANAAAQQKLVVAGYGGSFEDIMRKDIGTQFDPALFPVFEEVASAMAQPTRAKLTLVA